MTTALEEELDLDGELENHQGHFRSAHHGCASKLVTGQLVEANCGELFYLRRGVTRDRSGRCRECVKQSGWRSCPVCGEILL